MKSRWLAGILCLVLSPAVLAGVPEDMKALLEQQQAAKAYELGKKHPDEIGNPDFDFYFGIAAIDSGNAGEGVLALERYVSSNPDSAYGRLELARGYFVLGEDQRSKTEFQRVLDANPPPDVRASIERFLDALRSRESLYRTTTGAYIEAGYGYDNNANGGVGSGTTFRLFGLDFVVPDDFVKKSDGFLTLAGAVTGSIPIQPGLFLFGSAGFDVREYDVVDRLMQENYRVDGGVSYISGKNLLRGGIGLNLLRVEADTFRKTWSGTVEWRHQLDELQSFTTFGQYSRLFHTGGNEVRDSNFPMVGLSYRRALVSPMQPLLSFTGYVGKEDIDSIRSDLSREVAGIRITGSITPAPRWSLLAGVTWQKSHYQGPDETRLLDFTRGDRYAAVDFLIAYAISKTLSVRGELLFSENRSNDSLFDYKRNIFSVKLRHEFR